MTNRPVPQVFLCHNPWSQTLTDEQILRYLTEAAIEAEAEISCLIAAGHAGVTGLNNSAKPGASFGQVYLDPTNPRGQNTISERIFAIVLLGDAEKAKSLLPNAAAKADAVDRHGRPNGGIVEEANFCLGNHDFAWGGSARFLGAISAGSGLTATQDRSIAQTSLEHVMTSVHAARSQWLEGRREKGKHGWYNQSNKPGGQYAAVLDLLPNETHDLPSA
jgi:hypothetical protein